MIHVLQLLGAMALILIGVYALQVFIYGFGGYLFPLCWSGLILYALFKSTTK